MVIALDAAKTVPNSAYRLGRSLDDKHLQVYLKRIYLQIQSKKNSNDSILNYFGIGFKSGRMAYL